MLRSAKQAKGTGFQSTKVCDKQFLLLTYWFLEMAFSTPRCLTALIAFMVSATSAMSDGNSLFILQDSTNAVFLGNSLFVDQSLAEGSVVSGSLTDSKPARQIGGDNEAKILVTEGDGKIALNQTNLGGGTNTADVNLAGLLATGILTQDGFGNIGELSVSGAGASGSLIQLGNNNLGGVLVDGADASGSLTQDGNNNSTSLEVSGAGTIVNLIQNGNNIASSPTVRSNGGTVTITQSN